MSDIKKIPVHSIGSENSGENCSASEPFALRILDSSMAPEFEIDHIIIIDPSITPKNGDFVLFETSNSLIIRKTNTCLDGLALKMTVARLETKT